MIKNIIKSSAVVLSSLFIFSCSSSNDDLEEILDTEKPKITINKPTKNQHLHHGDALDVDALLTDNVELASYKIDIHYGGDGHTHFRSTTKADATTYKKWERKIEYTLKPELKEFHIINSEIIVPDDAQPGDYHFGIIAIDKNGNELKSYVDIEVADHDHDH